MSRLKDYVQEHTCGLPEAQRAVAKEMAQERFTALYREATLARDLADVKAVLQVIIRDKLESLR